MGGEILAIDCSKYAGQKEADSPILAGGRDIYLNNIVEQDHRFIKRATRPVLGFKAFHSAAATLAGIETAYMIRKGQLAQTGISAFKQFAALAA